MRRGTVFLLITVATVWCIPYEDDSNVMHTSMCCCGCRTAVCPVVGPTCPSPRVPCSLETLGTAVHCNVLQSLWDESRGLLTTANNPFLVPLSPQPSTTPADEESNILKKFVMRKRENSDIRMSPPKRNTTKKIDATGEISQEELSNLELTTLEKMNRVLSELQEMMSLVKGMVLAETMKMKDDRKEAEHNEKNSKRPAPPGFYEFDVPMTDLAIEDEHERNEIERAIQRMRANMKKIDGKLSEVDSAVSLSNVDIQTPLASIPRRTKRKASDEGNCNDPELGKIIMKNIGKDAKSSKRAVQSAAEAEFGGVFNVVCSPCEFSFVISSQKYCEGFKNEVACFAFSLPPTTVDLDE